MLEAGSISTIFLKNNLTLSTKIFNSSAIQSWEPNLKKYAYKCKDTDTHLHTQSWGFICRGKNRTKTWNDLTGHKEGYFNEWYRSICSNLDKCPQNTSREIKSIKICVASLHLSKKYFMSLHNHRKLLESYMPKLTSVGDGILNWERENWSFMFHTFCSFECVTTGKYTSLI